MSIRGPWTLPQRTDAATARQQFGALQAKTFPIYFGIGCAIPAGLLSHWILHHPDVASYAWHLGNADVLQAWTLATVIASQALNYFIIGPKATRCGPALSNLIRRP